MGLEISQTDRQTRDPFPLLLPENFWVKSASSSQAKNTARKNLSL